MKWIAPVAVVIAVLLPLATLGVHELFAIGAVAIFIGGRALRQGRPPQSQVARDRGCLRRGDGWSRSHRCQYDGDDPWWYLVVFVVGVLAVAAAAAWCGV
jgi:hypothetical protein